MEQIADGESPPFLYKYRAFNQYTKKLISHNEIFLASSSDFNDPFDSKIKTIFQGTDEDHKEYIRRNLKKRYRLSGQKLEDETQRLFDEGHHLDPQKIEDYYKRSEETKERELGIICLCSRNDNILMWSHYADFHRGCCFEFKHEGFFEQALKVKYSTTYPKVNYFATSAEEQMEAILLTKSDLWAYEEEYRIIETQKKGRYHFSGHLLTGVIFGCQMTPKDKDEIRKLVENRNDLVQLYEAKQKDQEFGLDIVPV